MSPLPHFSDVNLLCDGKRVIGVCRALQGLMEYPLPLDWDQKDNTQDNICAALPAREVSIGLCPNAERVRFASVKC
jgi:hypothetical protein